MTDVPKDFHTGSGNAQDKSTRGSYCASRVGPISIATDATRVDRATEVETGVKATRSKTGSLVCQYCGRDNFRRGAGLAQHQKSCSKRPNAENEPTLTCPDCQRKFHRPCGLAQHRKTCSNKQTTAADISLPKSLVCPKCDRTFQRACGLGRHIKSCKGTLCNVTASTNTDETTRSENEPPTSTEPESPVQSPVPDGTCKTQESANTATRQRNTHSTGDSRAFRPFKPTLHPSVAAKTSIKVEKPLWVPSAGCQGYWSKTNAALAAVIEQTCPGLSSKPPHLALQSLTKIVHSFFAEEETSSSPPEMKNAPATAGHTHLPPCTTCAKSSENCVGNGDSDATSQVNIPLN